MEAGAVFDIKPFGIRAMDSMRLEKSYRLIPREMSIEYSAYESGLDRFIRLDKENDFIKLLAKANTQSKIENYKEILERDKSKYKMYPNLSAALDKALGNRNYAFKPSCQENRSK